MNACFGGETGGPEGGTRLSEPSRPQTRSPTISRARFSSWFRGLRALHGSRSIARAGVGTGCCCHSAKALGIVGTSMSRSRRP